MLIQDTTLKMIEDGIYTVELVAKMHQMHPQTVREALADYRKRQANLDHIASLTADQEGPSTQRHITDHLSSCVQTLETVSETVAANIEAALTPQEVSRADETRNTEQQHITELLQIQALFDSWGVKLERCNQLGGYLVKGNGDDAFFLTEPTIESVIALRKAKVQTARIKEMLEQAGVDFNVLTATDTPVQLETQLQKVVFEAVQTALG